MLEAGSFETVIARNEGQRNDDSNTFNFKMKKLTILFLLFSILSFAQKAELKKEISKITEGKKATVAVSVLGIDFPFQYNNNNAKKKLPMQSVFKFHIALAVLDLVDQGKLDLNQKIFIKKSELLPNTWSPIREKNPDGNFEIPLAELLKWMVSESDNNCTDIILRLIGGTKSVQDFIYSNKISETQIKFNEEDCHKILNLQYQNYTNTKSLNSALKRFTKGELLSKNSTDFLYQLMVETSTGKNRLIAGLPKSVEIAHRTGTSFTENGLTPATNDAGIVTLPSGKKYAISVFVSDSKESFETNEKMISDISKVVYENLSKEKKGFFFNWK